ncbi:MAG: YceI family protein [Planctomycetales bacterium]|nr:YceI family protein [Planctomycetales bacterium]
MKRSCQMLCVASNLLITGLLITGCESPTIPTADAPTAPADDQASEDAAAANEGAMDRTPPADVLEEQVVDNSDVLEPPAEPSGGETFTRDEPSAPSDDAMTDDATATGASTVELTPANTSIEFIGNHKGDDPQPRHGSFQQFAGKAEIENGSLKSVVVDIETASLTTEIDNLTNHLKNADFFDVNQYPTANFTSTSITDQGRGMVEITGDLTLLGKTESVTFPASVNAQNGLDLRAEFELARDRWGMGFGPDRIENAVPITITVRR